MILVLYAPVSMGTYSFECNDLSKCGCGSVAHLIKYVTNNRYKSYGCDKYEYILHVDGLQTLGKFNMVLDILCSTMH